MRRDATRTGGRAPTASITTLALLLLPTLGGADPTSAPPGGDTPARAERPGLTDPIVCLSIRGFRDFVPRDEPTLTRDEKLQIYYEPFNYVIVRDGEGLPYRAHLAQDVRLRRAGSDRVLHTMPGVIDYAPESENPPTATYLMTSLSLKELPPGPYEIDLVLRDELAEGKPEAVRTIAFRIVPASEGPQEGP